MSSTKNTLNDFNYGDEVRETVTGFVGSVVCKMEYAWGCQQLGVQGKVDKDGKVPDILWFDVDRLIVIIPTEVKKEPKASGGICQKY